MKKIVRLSVTIPPTLAPNPAIPKALPLIGVGNNSKVQTQEFAKLPAIKNFPVNAKTRLQITSGLLKSLSMHLLFAISIVNVDNKHAKPPATNIIDVDFLLPNFESKIIG